MRMASLDWSTENTVYVIDEKRWKKIKTDVRNIKIREKNNFYYLAIF